MTVTAAKAVTPERVPLLGIADADTAQRMTVALKDVPGASRLAIASNLEHFRRLAGRLSIDVALLDSDFIEDAPLGDFLSHVAVSAPVILLAPPERQGEVAALVAAGEVEFVARVGNFFPLAASLVERRLRWAASQPKPGLSWTEFPGDVATVFRHEINNPLTGILGNAELVLAHRDRLSAIDAQRLQTVVDLAVRLRETIRRIGNAWESHLHEVKSA